MTDAEELDVRRELRAFRATWEAEREARRKNFWFNIKWAVPILLPVLGSFLFWGWSVTAGAGDGSEALKRLPPVERSAERNTEALGALRLVSDTRAGHETRLSILEDRYARIDQSLDTILDEMRRLRESRRASQ